MKPAVADTTFLSNFALVGRPELPALAFPGLVIPTTVLEELARGVQANNLPSCDWGSTPVLHPTESELSKLTGLSRSLHEGELACIALAKRLDAIVVTDDRKARKTALSSGLTVSGTLGALLNLVERKHLSMNEADELLARMRARGYHSPVRSLRQLLDD